MVNAAGTRIPDFFIVGEPKSGTTALYEMLRSHPQIFMPELKEPEYFARELHPNLEHDEQHPKTLEEYLELFAPAGSMQRVGEASVSYLRSRESAARIAQLVPDARIIALFREPATMMRSLHLQRLEDFQETEKDLRKAIDRERHERRAPSELWYSTDWVEYTEHLRRYHAALGAERVLVLIYDDFRADNAATIRKVLRFLEIDESVPISASKANETVLVRSPRAYALLRSLYLGQGRTARYLKGAIKAFTSQRIRRDGMRELRDRVLWGEPPPAEERLMGELRDRFEPHVAAFAQYVGRDLLSLWGYDRSSSAAPAESQDELTMRDGEGQGAG
jgi:Sulfotransferase family